MDSVVHLGYVLVGRFSVILNPCSSFIQIVCTKLFYWNLKSHHSEDYWTTENSSENPPVWTLEEGFSPSAQRISVKGTQWIRRRTNLTFIPGKTFPILCRTFHRLQMNISYMISLKNLLPLILNKFSQNNNVPVF